MSADMQKNWLELLMIALAAYRVARMVVVEYGPFGVFDKLRNVILARYDDEHWLVRGVTCPWCLSFWLVPIAYFSPFEIVLWLGLAGIASLLFTWELR